MRHTMTIAAALAVAFAASGCGGGSGSMSTPTSPGAAVVTVTITGHSGTAAFNPNPAIISSGQTVRFTNNDMVTHHIVLDDGTGQTADIPPGTTSAAISIGGNQSYHCMIHPGMVGGFNGSTGTPPPNCNYLYCALRKLLTVNG